MARTRSELIELWSNAREIALDQLADQTAMTCKNTKVYPDQIDDQLEKCDHQSKLPAVEFYNTDTISAGVDLKNKDGNRVVILNFADGTKPGGWGELGARTQEESLCRSSNLYESLLQSQCIQEYYIYNGKTKGKNSGTLIYSPEVTFFKSGVAYNNIQPVELDVITCAASKRQLSDPLEEYERRIINMISVCEHQGIKNIILGAWGCGAFNQDPRMISMAFCNALNTYGQYFDHIVFAIISTPKWAENQNYDIFLDTFIHHYHGKTKIYK